MGKRNKNKGIALIQVLIISIILTMLGIYINQTVRAQISVVSLMKYSFEVNLNLENAEAQLLHNLLTNRLYKKVDSDVSLIEQWNFYGKPFPLNENITVTIQDLSSLAGLNTTSETLIRALFSKLGYSGHEVRTFIDSLADWKDKDDLKRLNGAESDYYNSLKQAGPRNAYLQSVAEVNNIKFGSILTDNQWQQYFTKEIIPNFNPLNAPAPLLQAFIRNDNAYQEVIELRNEGKLTSTNFYQATAIEQDEYITFSTGSLLKVTIVAKARKNKLSKQFIVDLRPSTRLRPVTISQITWN